MARKQSSRADTSGARKPFWLIDGRLREADFFLERFAACQDLEEGRFMFSAFVTAAVAVRDAIYTTLARLPGAETWWRSKCRWLEAQPRFKYFEGVRNDIQHQGLNPLQGLSQSMVSVSVSFYLADDSPDGREAVPAAQRVMALLVSVAKEAYSHFWASLDLPSSYSLEDLARTGASLEQIEAEFGLPPGSSGEFGRSDSERLHFLKIYSQTATRALEAKYPPTLLLPANYS
jgi:hypothetical protein